MVGHNVPSWTTVELSYQRSQKATYLDVPIKASPPPISRKLLPSPCFIIPNVEFRLNHDSIEFKFYALTVRSCKCDRNAGPVAASSSFDFPLYFIELSGELLAVTI